MTASFKQVGKQPLQVLTYCNNDIKDNGSSWTGLGCLDQFSAADVELRRSVELIIPYISRRGQVQLRS